MYNYIHTHYQIGLITDGILMDGLQKYIILSYVHNVGSYLLKVSGTESFVHMVFNPTGTESG